MCELLFSSHTHPTFTEEETKAKWLMRGELGHRREACGSAWAQLNCLANEAGPSGLCLESQPVRRSLALAVSGHRLLLVWRQGKAKDTASLDQIHLVHPQHCQVVWVEGQACSGTEGGKAGRWE
jgi:hypothetical protein